MCDKKCVYCGITKSTSEFHKQKSLKDGFKNKCKECCKSYDRDYYIENSDSIRTRTKDYYENNKEIATKRQSDYVQANYEKHKAYQNQYKKSRRQNDIQFRIAENLRTRLYNAIKSSKTGSAIKDLGCSLEYFKQYIEEQFVDGMSWDNYGEWHLDHKLPLSWFNLEDREELRYACYFLNYQPLWQFDNISKGNRFS